MKTKIFAKAAALFLCAVLLASCFSGSVSVSAAGIAGITGTIENDSGQERIIVSLGDSYSSGEGLLPFYGQLDENGNNRDLDEKLADKDWLAHRSARSWPGRLTLPGVSGPMSEHKDGDRPNWYFAAASGATTEHFRSNQGKAYFKADYSLQKLIKELVVSTLIPVYGTGYEIFDFISSFRINPDAELEPQLNVLRRLQEEGRHVDYVTVTLGGNDLGFTEIVTKVFKGTNDIYQKGGLADTLEAAKGEIRSDGSGKIYNDLYALYLEIAEDYVDPDTAILVAGYPRLFAENIPWKNITTSPDMPFDIDQVIAIDNIKYIDFLDLTPDEARAVNEAVMEFNKAIEDIVTKLQKTGINIHYVDVSKAFEGHEAYSFVPFLNPVVLLARSEDLKENSLSSQYSIHPNNLGAQAYAQCVQAKIDELEAKKHPQVILFQEPSHWEEYYYPGESASSGISTATDPAGGEYADVLEKIQGLWITFSSLGSLLYFDGENSTLYASDNIDSPPSERTYTRYETEKVTIERLAPEEGAGYRISREGGAEYWLLDESPDELTCMWYENGELHYSGSGSLMRVTDYTIDDLTVTDAAEPEASIPGDASGNTDAVPGEDVLAFSGICYRWDLCEPDTDIAGGAIQADLNRLADDFYEEYQIIRQTAVDTAPQWAVSTDPEAEIIPCYYDARLEGAQVNRQLLSLRFLRTSYVHGAMYPVEYWVTKNYDLGTGMPLNLQDLALSEEAFSQLKALFVQKFRESGEVLSGDFEGCVKQVLESNGKYSGWYFAEDGLHMVWYPGGSGVSVDVCASVEELQDLLKMIYLPDPVMAAADAPYDIYEAELFYRISDHGDKVYGDVSNPGVVKAEGINSHVLFYSENLITYNKVSHTAISLYANYVTSRQWFFLP